MAAAKKTPRDPELARRAIAIDALLSRAYPDADCALQYQTPLELLIATILSAQCTDERVNQITPALFRKYRSAEAFLAAPAEELEEAIRPSGFFRNKVKSIQGACRRIVEVYGGTVPDRMEELLTLPGVARKTANVVLGTAYGKAEGIAVDTHVRRLSNRLGLTTHDVPEKIEADLMALLPRDRWTGFSHRLILHGRQVCHARKPACDRCSLQDLCPTFRAFQTSATSAGNDETVAASD
jgi:endonuclease-3